MSRLKELLEASNWADGSMPPPGRALHITPTGVEWHIRLLCSLHISALAARMSNLDRKKLLLKRARLIYDDVACVLRRHRLNQRDQALFVGHWVMHHTARHDMYRTRSDFDMWTVLIFNSKSALQNEEQLVFVFVAMPSENAMHLGNLDKLIIHAGDHTR